MLQLAYQLYSPLATTSGKVCQIRSNSASLILNKIGKDSSMMLTVLGEGGVLSGPAYPLPCCLTDHNPMDIVSDTHSTAWSAVAIKVRPRHTGDKP